MATSDRPSGLTALAVINFMLSVFQCFGVLGFLLSYFVQAQNFAERPPEHEGPPGMVEQLQDLAAVPSIHILLLSALMLASGVLLFVTGLGYLKRKKWLGRHATTLYVICDLGYVACLLLLMPQSHVEALGISLLRTAFYPVFLGTVIHTVFRRDLVR